MNSRTVNKIRADLILKRPLIHCITNPISINQCANTVLAVGARPIMAEHPLEAAEITASADALMLNIANITDARMESIRISAGIAAERGIPFLLDVVGLACSSLRRSFISALLSERSPDVIKGNYSEICALFYDDYRSAGVDAHSSATLEMTARAAQGAAEKYGCVVLASGKADIITDGKRTVYAHNGTPRLGEITGTGCMQGALAAAFLSCSQSFEAAAAACTVMGICGELAAGKNGAGSFQTAFFDALSTLDDGVVDDRISVTTSPTDILHQHTAVL